MSEIINELKALEVKYGITYKNVRLGDIINRFSYGKNKKYTLAKSGVPIISGITLNNGICGYTKDEIELIDIFKDSITISTRGEYSGTAFYHPGNFVLANNILVLEMPGFSKKSLLYITTALNKLPYSGYTNYPTATSLEKDIISLPHEPDGTLAIGFMEEFIATLERKRLATLERKRLATLDAYLSVKGWTTEDLGERSEIQNQLTNLLETREIEWKDVQLGDLFEINTGSLIESWRLKPGTVKRISAMSTNNGVLGSFNTELIDKSRHFENFISVNFFGTDGGIFYHPYKASVEMKVHVLQPKNFTLTKATGLYLSTALKPILKGFEYGNQLSSKMLKNSNFEIYLPHTPDGNLDLEFMEEFIELIEKLKIHNVANELQTRINLTESIISNPN